MKYYRLVPILCIALYSCATKTDFSNPKEVAQHFQENLRKGEIEKSFEYISDSSKQNLIYQDYLDYYDSKYDSILSINKYMIINIDQMTINTNYRSFRSFEIKEKVFNTIRKDTTVQFSYLSTINQGNKGWRIIWNNHLESAASKLADKSKFTDAIAAYDQIINLDPLNGQAFLSKAWAYYRLNNIYELEKNALKGSELAPNKPQSFSTLGLLYSEKGLPDLAKINLKKAINLAYDPLIKGSLYGNLAIEFEKSNQLDSSIYYCKKSIFYDPKNTHAIWLLGMFYNSVNNTDSSFYYFEKALMSPPMDDYLQSELYFNYANALLHQNGLSEVKSDLKSQEVFKKARALAIKALELDYNNSQYKNLVETIESWIKTK